jgi:hypothetical protein
MAGGDENSPVDMGRIVVSADYIRAETGAHFTYVHHTGKNAALGARGHSLLRAATDTEIEVSPGAMKATKQRDMQIGAQMGFSLLDMPLGEDENGLSIKSAVVEWTGETMTTTPLQEKKIAPTQRLLMTVLAEAINEAGESFRPYGEKGPLVRGVAEDIARKRYYARIAETPKPDDTPEKLAERQKKNFQNAVKKTLDEKTVVACSRNGERFLWLP